jgi:diacylglycerol kinase family enzyme
MTDGLLDVVFLPASTSLSLVRWALLIALGSPLKRRDVVFHRGHTVVVRSDAQTPYQLDGDEGGVAGNGVGDLRISVRPRAVRVLAGNV